MPSSATASRPSSCWDCRGPPSTRPAPPSSRSSSPATCARSFLCSTCACAMRLPISACPSSSARPCRRRYPTSRRPTRPTVRAIPPSWQRRSSPAPAPLSQRCLGCPPARLQAARNLISRVLGGVADGEGIVVVVGRGTVTDPLAAGGRHRSDGARLAEGALPSRFCGEATYSAPSTWASRPASCRGGSRSRLAGVGSAPRGARSRSLRGLDCREMLEAAAASEMGALILLGADPLADFPDRDLAGRGRSSGCRFFWVSTRCLNPSVQLCDVVLAAAGPTERAGTTTNVEGRVSRLASEGRCARARPAGLGDRRKSLPRRSGQISASGTSSQSGKRSNALPRHTEGAPSGRSFGTGRATASWFRWRPPL